MVQTLRLLSSSSKKAMIPAAVNLRNIHLDDVEQDILREIYPMSWSSDESLKIKQLPFIYPELNCNYLMTDCCLLAEQHF